MAKRIDWVKAKIEYVNNPSVRFEDISDKYGAPMGTVQARAKRESWTDARAQRNVMLQQNATRKNVNVAAVELAKYNEQDLIVAKLGRALAAKKLKTAYDENTELPAKDLRMLMGAIESAQRIARLSLGASTSNVNDQPLDPLMGEMNLEELSDDQLNDFQQNYRQLLASTFGAGGGGVTKANGSTLQ